MNQASIFTLEKRGNAYKDFDSFPSDLYVDTSAWIAAYNGSLSYNPVKGFMSDCLNNNTTLYHSEMILSEISKTFSSIPICLYISFNSLISHPLLCFFFSNS